MSKNELKDKNYESTYKMDCGGEGWFDDDDKNQSRSKDEIVVIQLKGEGGGATVAARKNGDSWLFWCDGSYLDPDNDAWESYSSEAVSELKDALPEWWANAYPFDIHPLFKEWFQLHYDQLINTKDCTHNPCSRSDWMKILYGETTNQFIPSPDKIDSYSLNKYVKNEMTCNKARSINIFLLDGNTDGVRLAQITMSTIQALAFRRPQLSRVKGEFKEITRPGVYLLLGIDPNDPDSKLAYIGESEDVAARLQFHNANEKTKDKFDFWTDTIALISKDENLTKSHARYVEALLISAASNNKRWRLVNDQKPSETGKLPKPDQAAMNEFLIQSKMLVGTLGWDIFKSITIGQFVTTSMSDPIESEPSATPEFFLSGSGYSATAVVSRTTGEWIIKNNSKVRLATANAIPKGALKMRDQLQADGILISDEQNLLFTQDCKFSSPSMAASVVTGMAINGRIAWKTNTGQSYADWDAEQILLTSPIMGGN